MKPTKAVLFVHGRAQLYLENISRYPDGSIESGYVINGAWYLEIVGDTHFAKRSKGAKSHVHFWRVPRFEEIAVAGRQWRGDYNTIMAQAQKEYDETH